MSETGLANDVDAFRRFAEGEGAVALDVDARAASVSLFRDSLQSALAHLTLSTAPVDPHGAPLRFAAGYLEGDNRLVPNAMAAFRDDRHFIAMNTALFTAVHEFAMFCFTQRDFFPDVGDPSLEGSPSPIDDRVPGLWLLDFTTRQGGRVNDEHGRQVTPRGESRYNVSVYLGLLMARFVWLHEYLHCMNGHARYCAASGDETRLSELAAGPTLRRAGRSSQLPSEARHCLELDADQSAFWASCQIQLAGRENIEGIAALDLALRMRLTLFGAYAMTWLFEEFQNYLDARDGSTHPAPYLRLQNLVRTGALHLAPQHADFAAWSRGACEQFDVMQRVIPSIYGTERVMAGASNPEVQARLDQLHERLHAVRADLAPFRYGAPA